MTRLAAGSPRMWTVVVVLVLGLTGRPATAQPPKTQETPLPPLTVEGLLEQPYNPKPGATACGGA
jgi:hypothetical protein